MRSARPVGSIAGARAPPHAPSRAHCRAPCTVRGPRAAPRPWEAGCRFGGAASLRISKSRAPGFPETERGVVSFSLISEKTDGPRAGGATGTPGFSICRTGYRASGVETTPAVAASASASASAAARRPPLTSACRPSSSSTSQRRDIASAASRPRNLHPMRRHNHCIQRTRRPVAAAFWPPPPSPPSPPPPPPTSSPHLRSAQVCMHASRARASRAALPAGGSSAQPACPSLQATSYVHLSLVLVLVPPQVPLSGRPLP